MPKVNKKEDNKTACYRWAFTWWVVDQKDTMIKWLNEHTKKWSFQQELCPNPAEDNETGGLHYQGRFSLIDKHRKPEVVKLLEELNAIKPVRISAESKKGEEGSTFYTMKDETKVDGPWTDKDKPKAVPKEWATIPHIDWHDEVKRRLEEQDRRKVLVVTELRGDAGKTAFRKIVTREGGVVVPVTMDTADKMMQCIYAKMDGRDINKRVTVVIDCPRAIGKNKDFWEKICTVIESIKDGMAYDWRHNWKEVYFCSPRVVLFANDAPPSHLLSQDRWEFFSPEQALAL